MYNASVHIVFIMLILQQENMEQILTPYTLFSNQIKCFESSIYNFNYFTGCSVVCEFNIRVSFMIILYFVLIIWIWKEP